MNQNLSKELAQKIMENKGEARGAALKTDAEFVLREKGEEGLREVERKLESLGFPIKYKEINAMEFYPIGLRILSLLAIKETFDFDDKKIQEMGQFAPKASLIVKLFMKYFLSMERTLKEVPHMWRSYCTVGDFKVIDYDKSKKFLVFAIENGSVHPVFCTYIKGFFKTGIEMVVKSPVVRVEETKCCFRGDKRHEYIYQWQ